MQKIFRYRKICRTEKSTLRSIQENETKNFPTENGNSPLPPYALKFPISEILWNTKGSPTNFFGLVRLKFSNRKSWNSPIMHTIYGCPNLSKSLKGFPQNFRHCETKKVNKIVITHDPKNFRYQTISETQGSPYDLSRYCETKKVDKIVIPLLSNKFLMPEHFWDTTVPPPNFWYCETKKIDKIVLPLIHKKNSKPEQFRNTEWFAHVVFRRRETEIFRRKNVTPLSHPLSFPTRNFLKHRRVRPRCFSVTWDKKFQTVKRDTQLLIPSFFPY